MPFYIKKMNHASLFSGIGAAEIAAREMGWRNLFHCEINGFCRRILKYHFPEEESYEDIRQTDFSQWRGRIDVLSGGFPCQPFSCAGRRKGTADDRYLWPEFARAVAEIRPAWVVGENVAGILSMVQPGQEADLAVSADLFGQEVRHVESLRRFVCDAVCDDLEELGYSVQPFLIPACAVGAPHRRDRVFLVAHRDGDGRGDRASEPRPLAGSRSEAHAGESRQNRTAPDCPDPGAEILRGGRERQAFSGGTPPDPERLGSGSLFGDTESPVTGGVGAARAGGERAAVHAQEQRCDLSEPRQSGACGPSPRQPGGTARQGAADGWPQEYWRRFPSAQPAVRGGDDGLPFDVDRLAVPYSRWRRESIKAYGNAIVPQVLLEIFRAIEIASSEIANLRTAKNKTNKERI